MPASLLLLFVFCRAAMAVVEDLLAVVNWRYARDPARQAYAARLLGITREDLEQSRRYTFDRHRFGRIRAGLTTLVTLGFVVGGGLGLAERWALELSQATLRGSIGVGLLFFALLGLGSFALSVPFAIYGTFGIEQKHGFNRQTPRGFVFDLLKGLLLGVILGGSLLSLILWVMERTGELWWLWAWLVVSGYSLLTAWLYPRVLAPVFNRFTPLGSGELRDRIYALAAATGFRAGGIWVMDASRRSTHGNAYFAGLFGEKRIVLFDTLLSSLEPRGVVAVLAHELGHFCLGHVWRQLALGVLLTGGLFFVMGQCWQFEALYSAFQLRGPSAYGALVVFGLWYGLLDFLLAPALNAVSRRNERAADAFAARHAPAHDLGEALLKLRETSRLLPLSHPLYSLVHHSHPPLLSRLEQLGMLEPGASFNHSVQRKR